MTNPCVDSCTNNHWRKKTISQMEEVEKFVDDDVHKMHVEEGENAVNQHFLLFSQYFLFLSGT